jgi:hypothetical protein
MDDVNSYAAPLTSGVPDAEIVQATGGTWREGKTLVMWKEAVLPDRCIRCNAPANGRRLIRKLNWHEPAIERLIEPETEMCCESESGIEPETEKPEVPVRVNGERVPSPSVPPSLCRSVVASTSCGA